MAGNAPNNDTHHYVYVYNINGNQWDKLPPPGQYMGRLQIVNSDLTVIGGWDNTTKKRTNKMTTYNNSSWKNIYPNLIKARVKPGGVTHLDYVIVAGGELDDNIFSDDIEVFNYKQSSHWVIVRMKLPEPMWVPSLTISDDLLYIVGYNRATGRTNATHKVPVDTITSSDTQLTSNQTVHWTELPKAPYYSTAVIPNSSSPVIIGGKDKQYVATVDISMLDVPNNSWKKIASLPTPRVSAAAVLINHDSMLVIGGYTGGKGVQEAKAHTISLVERGTVRLCHTQ